MCLDVLYIGPVSIVRVVLSIRNDISSNLFMNTFNSALRI